MYTSLNTKLRSGTYYSIKVITIKVIKQIVELIDLSQMVPCLFETIANFPR